MSISTDAVLFYGYIWSDERDLFTTADNEPDERDWEDILLERRGVPDPWSEHPGRVGGDEWVAANRARIDERRAAKRAVHDEYGVNIGYHGSGEWPVPYIHIDNGHGHIRAWRGRPKQLTAETLTVGEDWDERLTRFITDLGIDITGNEENEVKGPGWFLASYWG